MKHTIYIIVSVLLAACSPQLHPPQVSIPDTYIYNGEFAQQTDETIGPNWWEIFSDTTLNRLIERALIENRDVAIAASRVEQARLNLNIVRAQYLPAVEVGITAQGEYTPQTKIVERYAIEPSLTWEISLFGALRNAKLAAKADILTSQWAAEGVKLSLAAEVATTYFTLLQYERDLNIARRSYQLRHESAALIDSMFSYGMTDGVALEQAHALVYTAQADIPLYTRSVKQARLSLDILLGQTPQPSGDNGAGLNLLVDYQPMEIPIGLPSELLKRRPDIMQAYYSVQRASADARAARSARFPSIVLTSNGGVASATLKALTAANPWAWEAVGSLTQPLFAFGKLRRSEQAAVESYKQSALAYEQTVIEALGDVEAALIAITTHREQTHRYSELVISNNQIATMTQALYGNGMSDYLDVIDAQRELYDSQMEYVNLVAQQYINYVNLFKALGGGW